MALLRTLLTILILAYCILHMATAENTTDMVTEMNVTDFTTLPLTTSLDTTKISQETSSPQSTPGPTEPASSSEIPCLDQENKIIEQEEFIISLEDELRSYKGALAGIVVVSVIFVGAIIAALFTISRREMGLMKELEDKKELLAENGLIDTESVHAIEEE